MGKKVFINLSNHPSCRWQDAQRKAAENYGEIVDCPFPNVSSGSTEEDVQLLAGEIVQKILALEPAAVMCQGEFTLTFSVVSELLKKGIPCVAACTERVARETVGEDGLIVKTSEFNFVKFREFRI